MSDLQRHIRGWLLDSEVRSLSRATIENRRIVLDRLHSFCEHRGFQTCGSVELKEFLASLGSASSGTKATYHGRLRSFFNYLVEVEEELDISPMKKVRPTVDRPDQVRPFTSEEVGRLLDASKRTSHPRRDYAIVLFLLDTGVRASEFCGLRKRDVNLDGKRAIVHGKGNKNRTILFSAVTAKALWAYLDEKPREPDDPLFLSDRGRNASEPMTRSGLLQLINRLGRAAGVANAHPHRWRHTFAVDMLRGGANLLSVQTLLGHTALKQTQRYLTLADADLEKQHQIASPVSRLRKGKR